MPKLMPALCVTPYHTHVLKLMMALCATPYHTHVLTFCCFEFHTFPSCLTMAKAWNFTGKLTCRFNAVIAYRALGFGQFCRQKFWQNLLSKAEFCGTSRFLPNEQISAEVSISRSFSRICQTLRDAIQVLPEVFLLDWKWKVSVCSLYLQAAILILLFGFTHIDTEKAAF